MKEKLISYLDRQKTLISDMSDRIFDSPETGGNEAFASGLLAGRLAELGFETELGTGGLPTAFRAVYENGTGGPSVGLLCEYDALEGMGHACAHHMQGPAVIYAAAAIKEAAKDRPYRLVIYGTPAEETSSGKIAMIEAGCFKDIDVALMTHGGPETTVDIKSLALSSFRVKFRGKAAHAAIRPEAGRSALDALLLAFNAVEFLREHVREDVKMHYAIRQTSPVSNVVPDFVEAAFSLRSFSREYLDSVCGRFRKIIEGAALMTETSFEITAQKNLHNKIPAHRLNGLMTDNARAIGAPGIIPFRERTGSSDFGNVLHIMPGACIRVAFVPPGTSSHSQEFLDAGKSDAIHGAALNAAKILAMTAWDLIGTDGLMGEVKAEFERNLAESMK